jgi:hypothetical protein
MSVKIINDVFLGHRSTRSHISVFHPELSVVQHSLSLHGIPHHNMNLLECCYALIHHIITGACYDNPDNAKDAPSSHSELATCRAMLRGFSSAAEVSEAALNIILNADTKGMSTEHYYHVAAAMNISASGNRNNFRFKPIQTASSHSKPSDEHYFRRTR